LKKEIRLIKKESRTEKRNNDFWLYKILALGLVIFLMLFYLVLVVLEHGLEKARLRKETEVIEALRYKVLYKITSYLKKVS